MSIYAQGFSTKLLLGVEESFKTPPATPPAARLPVISPSVRLDVNRFRSQALTGSAQPRPPVDGKHQVGGNIQLECSAQSLMLPLYALFGTYASLTGGTNTDHVFTFGDQPYMFIEQQHLDITQYLLWNGLKFGRGQFRFEREGLMQATFDVLGAKQSISTSTIVTGTVRDDSGGDPFDYTKLSIKQGGTSIIYLQAVTLDINRNLEGVSAIDGTTELQDILSSIPSITGTITALFKDAVLLDLGNESAETSLELLQVSGSLGYGMYINLPTVKLSPSSPTIQGQGVPTIDFNFDGYARGSASDTSARIASKAFATIAVTTGVDDLLNIKIDGGGTQAVTLTAGAARTPTQIAGEIDTVIAATGSAFVENGRVVIKSDSAGATSSVQVEASSTADTTLGYGNTVVNGYGAQSIVWTLMNGTTPLLPA